MKVRFDEHLYKKKSKIYWHGSSFPEFDQSKSFWKMLYLTQNLKYALEYSKRGNNADWGYLYQCHFKDTLNIFNANDTLDRTRLLKKMNISKEDKDDFVNDITSSDWLHTFGKKGRDEILEALIDLGYDGFFNYEKNFSVNSSPSIGVFDSGLVEIDKVYYGNEIQNLIDNLSNYKQEQKDQIDYYLSGGSNPEISLIPGEILRSPKRKTYKEYIEDKENHLADLERDYGKDDSWYIQRRVGLYRERLEREKKLKIRGYAKPKRLVDWGDE